MKLNDNAVNASPLGRAFRLKELPGVISKTMDIPPGRKGVIIYSDGKVRNLEEGHRRVISSLERLQGKGAGLRAGYVPSGIFSTWVRVLNLFSGDRELIDLAILCDLRVNPTDGARMLQNLVLQRGSLAVDVIDLDETSMNLVLTGVLQNYAAEDLIHGGFLDDRIMPQIQAGLMPVLANLGIGLDGIRFLSAVRSEDRVEVAEKAAELAERLQQVEVSTKLAQINTWKQMDEFISQNAPELQSESALHAVSEKGGAAGLGDASPFILRNWAQMMARKARQTRFLRLERLVDKKSSAEHPPVKPRNFRTWWMPRTIWMIFTLVLGIVLNKLVEYYGNYYSWKGREQIETAIWGFVILALLESIKALYKKWEEIHDLGLNDLGGYNLEILANNDRGRVDRLVREQCSQDMKNASQAINNIRHQVYREGNESLALECQRLEREIEVTASDILNLNYRNAPYLGDLMITDTLWNDYLDEDETILIQSGAFVEDVSGMVDRFSRKEFSPDALDVLRGALNRFRNRFMNRSRVLRLPKAEPEKMGSESKEDRR